MQVLKWWTDSSFVVYPAKKSNSGILGTLGRGAIFARSVTLKPNTTCLTESEVVDSSEVPTQALWTASFLRNQGHDVRLTLLQGVSNGYLAQIKVGS